MSRKLPIILLTGFLTGCAGNFANTKNPIPVIEIQKCPPLSVQQICQRYDRPTATSLAELKSQLLELELAYESCMKEVDLWRELWEKC